MAGLLGKPAFIHKKYFRQGESWKKFVNIFPMRYFNEVNCFAGNSESDTVVSKPDSVIFPVTFKFND